MTDQELQQLAREYAEQQPPQTEDEKLKEFGMFLNATEVFEPFLRWLTKTHCIVSREKVRKLFHQANCDYGNDPDTVNTLESIFGKSALEKL